MFDSLANTFYLNTVAAYDEYVKHRDANVAGLDRHTRAAVAAAIALYHFREHLPAEMRPSVQAAIEACPEYALIQGVANAGKHSAVTRGQPLVSSAADIQEIAVVTRLTDAEGDYPHLETKVIVRCSDGSVANLDQALTRVLNWFGSMLKARDVCPFQLRPEKPLPGSCFVERDKAGVGVSLEAMRGLAWRTTMELLEWDSIEGLARPVDLTGSEIAMRIYKPPIATLTLSHPDEGEISTDIPLTARESVEYRSLSTQEQRDAFMDSFLERNRAQFLEQLQAEADKLETKDD
jgi:hypothetical protein